MTDCLVEGVIRPTALTITDWLSGIDPFIPRDACRPCWMHGWQMSLGNNGLITEQLSLGCLVGWLVDFRLAHPEAYFTKLGRRPEAGQFWPMCSVHRCSGRRYQAVCHFFPEQPSVVGAPAEHGTVSVFKQVFVCGGRCSCKRWGIWRTSNDHRAITE